MAKYCRWNRDKDNGQCDTQCGEVFIIINSDGLKQQGFNYCVYCGLKLKETSLDTNKENKK